MPSMTGSTESELQWYFAALKGSTDDDVTEADLISCVEFNETGDLLATGDKGGRVVVFQRDQNASGVAYNVYSTFQSHEPEFDYLKSIEIEEKINQIKWVHRKNNAHFLLSTNDKTIKLWKMQERSQRVSGYNLRDEYGRLREPSTVTSLTVPSVVPSELVVEASPRRVYANAHTYHINSVSVNSDQLTFLSADDLRINLWHLDITNQSFNIVDLKPANMEELSEVITAAEFHPTDCNMFVHSSSKGIVRVCDMRAQALCDRHAQLLEEAEDPSSKSFFSEIISSISDVQLSRCGRYVLVRDFMTLKVWDLHQTARPVETYPVHDYLRSKLCSLYETDCLFDKFSCAWSPSDRHLLTGSYNGMFKVFDRQTKVETMLEANKDCEKMGVKQPMKARKVFTAASGGKRKKDELAVDTLDFTRKILHTSWHPDNNTVAVATANNLYLFTADP